MTKMSWHSERSTVRHEKDFSDISKAKRKQLMDQFEKLVEHSPMSLGAKIDKMDFQHLVNQYPDLVSSGNFIDLRRGDMVLPNSSRSHERKKP
jgi:hypothetical protein